MNKNEMLSHMSYDSLQYLRKSHPAWKLLASRNAPFVISFLYLEFIDERKRGIPESEIENSLSIYLEDNKIFDENKKQPSEYLREWSEDSYGWLRRFHPTGLDEIHYDLTSTAQKAIEWLVDLKQESFIGTESRLILIFDLLNQIVEQTETDPEVRILELERQKAEIEAEIARAKKGEVKILQPTQIKERFMQATSMSHEILSDFRAVEQNFRELNRNMREKITKWDKGKGELIGDYFSNQSDIYSSDQGRSFQAFFDFLMSKSAQDNFDGIIEKLRELHLLKDDLKKSRFEEIAEDWLEGSSHVWSTVEAMSEQLRRYVDESFLEEERRINQLVKSIEANTILLLEDIPNDFSFKIDETTPDINLIFDRCLFIPSKKTVLNDDVLEYGQSIESSEALYSQVFIDKDVLKNNVLNMLKTKKEIGLCEVLEDFPLEYGLSEYLSYLTLNKMGLEYKINYDIKDTISWIDDNDNKVEISTYRVEFYMKEGAN